MHYGNPAHDSQESGRPLATLCPHCGAKLGGTLLRHELFSAECIAQLLGGVVSARTARAWMRAAWLPTFALPGVRGPLVSGADFATAFERVKRPATRAPTRRPASKPPDGLQSKCRKCGTGLGGVVARLELLTVADIVEMLGDRIHRDTVQAWIRSGLVRGFQLPGVRGWLVDADHFLADLEALRRQPRRVAEMLQTPRRPDGRGVRTQCVGTRER